MIEIIIHKAAVTGSELGLWHVGQLAGRLNSVQTPPTQCATNMCRFANAAECFLK